MSVSFFIVAFSANNPMIVLEELAAEMQMRSTLMHLQLGETSWVSGQSTSLLLQQVISYLHDS